MIDLKSVSKIYGKKDAQVIALDQVFLKINSGDLVAITGPSGSGKSTLLNIIGCLDKPTNGKYYFDNTEIDNLDSNMLARYRNQRFGFVVQDFALINKYTVRQNVAVPLDYAGIRNKAKTRAIDNILDRLGIADKKNVLAENLSGGQRQRVAIARALVNNPDVILADEPTGALDQRNGGEVVSLLKEINARGKTVIIVTHDISIAEQCSTIIKILDGKVC